MTAVVVWTIIALVAGAGVLLVASVASREPGDRGLRSGLEDLRNGVVGLVTRRDRKDPERAAVRESAEPVDVRLDEFLSATAVDEEAYLRADDITDTLAKAREKAARTVPWLGRRSA
ncbi:hypothetical protein QUV83_02160 [Cellulomonas cellasea]|uniref:hypothetical protein n=1 Tax=Cellulomonas cellasea TaxID=43670 RepID=UPI0025A382C7|nr:hypothetical protein [Cellulomonas cellasea]MDM8083571.1 hypothetical protein [Cellulomonas cellasea]